MTPPRRAISYRRVSSAEQVAGMGPAEQAEAIRRYAAAEGIQLVEDRFEDVSGTTPLEDRSELRAALAVLARGEAEALLVARRDRLARDWRIAGAIVLAFEAVGASIIYAEGGNGAEPGSELLDALGHALSDSERRRLVARLQAAKRVAAEMYPLARKHGGPVPLGYRRAKDGLAVDPEGAVTVRAIFRRLADGAPLSRVAAEVGLPRSTVGELAQRDLYKRSQRPGERPLVDPRIYNAARLRLEERRKR